MKEKIRIKLDYLQGAIWISDQETGQPITGIKIVDNDEIIKKINYQISSLFSSYYEFNSNNRVCYFNKEQEKKDKDKMLSFLKQLNNRLAEINDGTCEVIDLETPRVEKL